MTNGHQSGAEHTHTACGPQWDHQKANLSQLRENGPHGPPASLDEPSPAYVVNAQDSPCN